MKALVQHGERLFHYNSFVFHKWKDPHDRNYIDRMEDSFMNEAFIQMSALLLLSAEIWTEF